VLRLLRPGWGGADGGAWAAGRAGVEGALPSCAQCASATCTAQQTSPDRAMWSVAGPHAAAARWRSALCIATAYGELHTEQRLILRAADDAGDLPNSACNREQLKAVKVK
jgi:hypothetical protein